MIQRALFKYISGKGKLPWSVARASFGSNKHNDHHDHKEQKQSIEFTQQPDKNNAGKVFFESITSTIKGIQHVNYIVESDSKITAQDKIGKKKISDLQIQSS